MPLIKSKSKKAVGENIETEEAAGKSPKQSLAIALSVQRRSKSRKKMANGGPVDPFKEVEKFVKKSKEPAPIPTPLPPSSPYGGKFAQGGEVSPSDLMSDEERASSIADAIMRKRRKMAKSGEVDIQENGAETPADPSPADERNEAVGVGDDVYDTSQLSDQPEDSNEHGDDIESDKHDMVSRIRAKLKSMK